MSVICSSIRQILKTSPSRYPVLWQVISRHPHINSNNLSDYERQHKTPKCIKVMPIPPALYGGRHTVTLLPGNGVGPELVKYVQHLFHAMGAPVDFEIMEIDDQRQDNVELEQALVSIKRNGVAIKGNIETRSTDPSIILRNIAIRNELDLYTYVLWCKSYPHVPARYQDLDLILVRQNTEGEYAMLEHTIGGEKVVESLKILTVENSIRIAKYAFEFAQKHKRKKITTVHKASMLFKSDGTFLEICKEVAKRFPEIKHTDASIDYCCRRLVSDPRHFDVILTTNLYGTVLSNVMCGLTGGPGLHSGKNYGDQYAVFETATRNTGREIAGKNVANPVCMLNASIDMLYHLGHRTHARQIKAAINRTLCEDKIHTPDLGGKATSTEMMERIIDYTLKLPPQ